MIGFARVPTGSGSRFRPDCAELSRALPETRRNSVPIGMDPSPSYGLAKQRAKIEGV